MNRAVGGTQRAELVDAARYRVGDFALMPHGSTTRGAAHDVEPQSLDLPAIVALKDGFIAAKREAGRVPVIEPEQ